MRIVFMGTPEFSATVLKSLCENDYRPIAVVTRADKPAGRGYELKPSAVKLYAVENGIDVFQPEKLSDETFISTLASLKPDIIIVVAYGRILPKTVLDMPKYGCINAHASLLPKYRGAAPMQRAIMNGDSETGVTIMKMDVGLDTGDMLLTLKTPISETDDLESVHDRLAVMSGKALIEALKLIESDQAVYTPQDHDKATYADKILSKDEIIDFNRTAKSISAQIRALSPFPYAKCKYADKSIKILQASVSDEQSDRPAGEILSVKNGVIKVNTAEGILNITKVFPESKRRMTALDFVNGSKIKPGDMFN